MGLLQLEPRTGFNACFITTIIAHNAICNWLFPSSALDILYSWDRGEKPEAWKELNYLPLVHHTLRMAIQMSLVSKCGLYHHLPLESQVQVGDGGRHTTDSTFCIFAD